MISDSLKVLTPQEITQLVAVPTTVDQAWQILERNFNLLEALYKDTSFYEDEIGCPHCLDASGYCGACAWSQGQSNPFNPPACCTQQFGGVAYNSTSRFFFYSMDDEFIEPEAISVLSSTEPWLKVETLLLGHLEWAKLIIDHQHGGPQASGK